MLDTKQRFVLSVYESMSRDMALHGLSVKELWKRYREVDPQATGEKGGAKKVSASSFDASPPSDTTTIPPMVNFLAQPQREIKRASKRRCEEDLAGQKLEGSQPTLITVQVSKDSNTEEEPLIP
ncbi:hypothetical protein RJT34_12657 [Clitoria ternatea]|uniref:Uncharacterized protein n=1 Tax=Clitoria ternatea TaxID=43366 RepID=A0AAN9JME9_CLITE